MKLHEPETHIDDATLAAFIDNRLIGKKRDAVIRHLLVCDRCRALSMEASVMVQSEAKDQKSISWLKYAVPVGVAASVMVLVFRTEMSDLTDETYAVQIKTEQGVMKTHGERTAATAEIIQTPSVGGSHAGALETLSALEPTAAGEVNETKEHNESEE